MYTVNQKLQFNLKQFIFSEISDQPLEFLTDLLNRCVEYREGYSHTPPLLFEDKHILSLYKSLDPLECGTITYAQYKIGTLIYIYINNYNIDIFITYYYCLVANILCYIPHTLCYDDISP